VWCVVTGDKAMREKYEMVHGGCGRKGGGEKMQWNDGRRYEGRKVRPDEVRKSCFDAV
jgi:hypothetical protein